MPLDEEKLVFGEIGQSQIARWLRARGNGVLPVYEKEIDTGKGPQVFLPNDVCLIAPDLLVFNHENVWWIEAKHKRVFTWHRITERWTTGVDLRHYNDYLRVNEMTPWPVWLLFLHSMDRNDDRPDEPWPCPVGLFGHKLTFLVNNENHRCEPRNNGTGWGNTGMVYWAHEKLLQLATLEEVHAASLEMAMEPA